MTGSRLTYDHLRVCTDLIIFICDVRNVRHFSPIKQFSCPSELNSGVHAVTNKR